MNRASSWFLAVLAWGHVCSAHASDLPDVGETELVFGSDAVEFVDSMLIAYDPAYPQNHAARVVRLDSLAHTLFDREAAGEDLDCSRQLFVEAKWLVKYTAWWSKIDARLDELEGSFAIEDQSFADDMSPIDQLWGRCNQAEFIKLEATLEELFVLADRFQLPRETVRTEDWLETPEDYRNYLESLVIGEPAISGEDHRSRLGSITGILSAAYKKPKLIGFIRLATGRPVPEDVQQDALQQTFMDFVDRWQDPETGYWGAWYRYNDQIYRTADLSYTYHIIHARRGDVDHWPQIIETTFAMRDQTYPYGWLSNGKWNNHNNYDVARIFHYGWEYLDADQQTHIAELMQEMIDWCFENTVMPSYEGFRYNPELGGSLGAELYFGVSFLDAVDYFKDEPWFGDIDRPAAPGDVCENLMRYAARLDDDTYVAGALAKLRRNCEPLIDG